jgi:hypothetical protein
MLPSSFFNGKGGTLGLKKVETFEKKSSIPIGTKFYYCVKSFSHIIGMKLRDVLMFEKCIIGKVPLSLRF